MTDHPSPISELSLAARQKCPTKKPPTAPLTSKACTICRKDDHSAKNSEMKWTCPLVTEGYLSPKEAEDKAAEDQFLIADMLHLESRHPSGGRCLTDWERKNWAPTSPVSNAKTPPTASSSNFVSDKPALLGYRRDILEKPALFSSGKSDKTHVSSYDDLFPIQSRTATKPVILPMSQDDSHRFFRQPDLTHERPVDERGNYISTSKDFIPEYFSKSKESKPHPPSGTAVTNKALFALKHYHNRNEKRETDRASEAGSYDSDRVVEPDRREYDTETESESERQVARLVAAQKAVKTPMNEKPEVGDGEQQMGMLDTPRNES